MKKHILLLTLLVLALLPAGYAQDIDLPKTRLSRADATFNIPQLALNHHHEAELGNGNKMVIDLFLSEDYELLKHTDSLFHMFYKDLDQFKDSLVIPPSGNIRIDYFFAQSGNYQAIRFKQYPADGDLYADRNGTLSRLKLEKDTVRMLIAHNHYDPRTKIKRYTPVQLTFLLNRYQDLRQILDTGHIQRIIDKLSAASNAEQHHHNPNPYAHRSTIRYNPAKDSLVLRDGLFYGDEYSYNHYWTAGNSTLVITGNLGLGVIRDRLSPMAEARIEIAKPWGFGGKERTVFAVSAAPYFTFERSSTQANWFLNASAGSVYNGSLNRLKFSSLEVGAGYLLKPVSSQLPGTTFKIFGNIGLPKGFVISPEIIFTDNCRQVFPGTDIESIPITTIIIR